MRRALTRTSGPLAFRLRASHRMTRFLPMPPQDRQDNLRILNRDQEAQAMIQKIRGQEPTRYFGRKKVDWFY